MWLSFNMTIALLIAIWLATVYLAFLVARKGRAERGNLWIYITMIIVLAMAAIFLALDHWIHDIV